MIRKTFISVSPKFHRVVVAEPSVFGAESDGNKTISLSDGFSDPDQAVPPSFQPRMDRYERRYKPNKPKPSYCVPSRNGSEAICVNLWLKK